MFPDDDEGPAAAGPPMIALPPAAAVDDAPPPPAPHVDTADFTNLDVLNEATTRRALRDLGPPAAVAGKRTTLRAARADNTEDDDAPVFATPGTRKRGSEAR